MYANVVEENKMARIVMVEYIALVIMMLIFMAPLIFTIF